MIELKFSKSLPCKFLNNNKGIINLVSTDLYVDQANNRYAYLNFVNLTKKPFFSLQLAVKEYDSAGQLLKEDGFYLSQTYGPKGAYVTDEPIQLERECEALDVYIVLVIFSNHVFFNDSFTKLTSEHVPTAYSFPAPNGTPMQPVGAQASDEISIMPTIEAPVINPELQEGETDENDPLGITNPLAANSVGVKEIPVNPTGSNCAISYGNKFNFAPIIVTVVCALLFMIGFILNNNFIVANNVAFCDICYETGGYCPESDYLEGWEDLCRNFLRVISIFIRW